MCGISAVVSVPSRTSNTRNGPETTKDSIEDRLEKSLELLKHRGPDARGIWVDPTKRVGLGHTRLSIIDLSPEGNQPLHDDQGHVHAVINGEIYDHDRLRDELSRSGYKFKGESDSEVAVALYQRYGAPQFLEHCRGEFAMVIYDDRSGEIWALRDRMGIKPLFWTIAGNELLIASEIKAFLPMGWKPEWDVESIASGRTGDGRWTLFKGVQKVEPGFCMRVTRDASITHSAYWDLDYPNKNEVDNRTIEDMVKQLREELIQSVRLRLRADVPVGVYLSGGLDSSMVAGITKHLMETEGTALGSQDPTDRITAFTLGLNSDKGDQVFNESAFASRTAQALGVRHIVVDANEEMLASNFEDAVWHCEGHIGTLAIPAKIVLSQTTRKHGIRVILTGEGADEMFGGYPWFLPDALLEPDSTRPDARVNQDLGELYEKAWEQFLLTWSRMATSKLPLYMKQVRPETWESLNHIKTPLALNSFTGTGVVAKRGQADWDADKKMQTVLESLPRGVRDKIRNDWHPLNSALYYASKNFLANHVIPQNGDRTEMSHSIEGRPPILDHKVVEIASRMPPSVKHGYFPDEAGLRSGHSSMRLNLDDEVAAMFREKWILREAARPFISEEIYRRPKHGFVASNSYPIGGPVHRLVTRFLTKENVEALGFVDWPQVEESLASAFGEGAVPEDFSNVLTVAGWVVLGQRFGVATASWSP